MKKKYLFFLLIILVNTQTFISAQTHSSVDIVDHGEVYVLLESAQLRGLIPFINQTKPWLRSLVKDNLGNLGSPSYGCGG